MPAKIAIDKNVEMPTGGSSPAGQTKYPFAEMEVGDSFAGTGSIASIRSSYAYCRRHHDKSRKFTIHRTATGYRCWRTA